MKAHVPSRLGSFAASLRVRLLLLVLLAVLPAVALLVYSYAQQRRTATNDARAHALEVTELAASDARLATDQGRQLLIGISRLEEVRGTDNTGCDKLFADLLSRFPLYANLGVINRDGSVFCSGLPAARNVNLSDRDYFQQAMTTHDFAIGAYQIGRITNRPSFNIAYPVLDDNGATERVVFAAVDLAWLNQFFSGASLPQDTVVLVTDRTGTILARYPDDGGPAIGSSAADTPLMNTAIAQQSGTAQVADLDGTEKLFAFAPLTEGPSPGGYLLVGFSPAGAYAAANRDLAGNLLALAAVALFILGSGWIAGHFAIVKPVQAMLGTVRRIGGGDLSARTGARGHGELATLGGAVDDMAAALQEHDIETARARAALEAAHADTVELLAGAAEAHDATTGRHLARVRAISEMLARKLGESEEQVEAIGVAAILHDIGKIRVPDQLLMSPNALSEDEWGVMRRHTVWGSEFLRQRSGFELASVIARHHHERWDGAGYPDGLRGESIPRAATIVTVADSLDAMTNDRPYRDGGSLEWAVGEIARESGAQFDPRVVGALRELYDEGSLAFIEGGESVADAA